MQDIIDRYCSFHRTDADGREYATRTRRVRIEPGIHHRAADILEDLIGDGPLAIVFDENTRRVAGDDVLSSLRGAGHDVSEFLISPQEAGEAVVCDDGKIEEIATLLGSRPFTHAIAVGAGTMNDLVKMAAF
jgi:glycerol dehydrogenase-like iron-containing ADH family enzyme